MSGTLAELSAHLTTVDQDASTPLDTDLLERSELFANTPEYRSEQWKTTQPLFLQLASLLPKLQQDPAPLVHVITKLTAPYRFEDIKDVDFETALALEAAPFHALILTLLEKAATSSANAQLLANRPTVVSGIVRLWLCVPDAGVASQAGALLVSLLRVSKNEPDDSGVLSYGTAPMWKRLFSDRDISSLYYHYTSLKQLPGSAEPQLQKRDKTIAQARLLEWLPQVGKLDWNVITTGHGLLVEKELGLAEGQGLLHYASLKMVDTGDDILMHMTLINFFTDLITTVTTTSEMYDSSVSLDFLKSQGIHGELIAFHTSDTPSLEHSFLSPRTAHYIGEYASTYPDDFEKSSQAHTIRQHAHRNISKGEASDLSILAAMPRSSLVPSRSGNLAWDECPLLDIPISRTNPDALKTLATVFHGPLQPELTFPPSTNSLHNPSRTLTEQTFARLLTSLYVTKNPQLFTAIIAHAETLAMQENALAAISLLRAIITANWASDPLPPTINIAQNDPILMRLSQFPATGVELVLDPRISGAVLPFLLKPATSFSGLVGGKGDAENSAYVIASAKFGVLKALEKRLQEGGEKQDVLVMVRRRVGEGVWGTGGGRGVGGRIGTLEL
ncbi:hypothetical protein P154DRAFT_436677 [Amniculicola lignicola CBS 123094]|uniref:Uncharacterized protein n=1 Tax=Amniculicola lignicola CBS 123094 TaxID=1392246 RepID=A0A6A5WKQ9_9PLEO|nr:hypothetical protein P154DRAFT_436677 [Amniculicola lignicola CBS 123094]